MAKETLSKKKTKKPAAKNAAPPKNTDSKKAAAVTASAVGTVAESRKKRPLDAAGKLARWYKWSGVAFLLQGLAVVLFGRDITASITMQYPTVDALASEATGHEVIGLASRHFADMPVAWALATMLVMFGIVNILMATLYRPYIATSLRQGVNMLRWFSLGIGGGLLAVNIALVSSISSVAVLLFIFLSVAGAALLAAGVEVLTANNNGAATRFARVLCALAAAGVLLPWVVIGMGLVGVVLWDGRLPGYIYSVYACQFLLTLAVLLAGHFRAKRQGRWADAAYTERAYISLAFIAATLLTWQVFAGLLV